MDALGHYLRIHLTGSAGGIELFGRGERMSNAHARTILHDICSELVVERRQQLQMARRVGIRPAPLFALAAKVGERVSRLKPNGDPVRRTALSDLVDLEAMRTALAGKVAGWDALLCVADQHEGLDSDELAALARQGERQLEQVRELHAEAATRALSSAR
ncbi:hypothetical protein [Aeromicrobium sp. CF3.5]|uniref:hypothetical protein n=1 Tax=Aeromicrobium sp. CF3.5 TaxID=3373078 RepID=UPI003EE4944E